jgi:hypothetical protein
MEKSGRLRMRQACYRSSVNNSDKLLSLWDIGRA